MADSLLSDAASRLAAEALKAVKQPASRAAAAPAQMESPVFRSGNTVENLVQELLRPMMKEWLDANLPKIVQQAVEKEVRRIASLNAE
jgi:cell pole-organizing protein PopZ